MNFFFRFLNHFFALFCVGQKMLVGRASRGAFMRLSLLSLLLSRAAGGAPYTNAIASGGASSLWFSSLSTWHVPTDTVPASPAIPADSPARDMVFGAPLIFSLFPVNPASSWQVECVFLDDGGGRQQALTVSGEAVAPRFALPAKTIYTARWNISSAAVSAGAALDFSFASLAGPNAILSSFVLYSSDARDPPIAPPPPRLPSHALPRLSPRPLAVAGVAAPTLELNGVWDFCAATACAAADWRSIVVPGEYTLQGVRVPAGAPVTYHTTFTTPADWAGLRVKLRAEGIYSNCAVLVNGAEVGGHLGGFTPFELDLTAALLPATPGAANNLTIVVTGASLADTLASATQYATHDLGGITRRIALVALPPLSLADVHAVTRFQGDGTYARATLQLNISLANDGAAATAAPAVVAAQLSFAGARVAAGNVTLPAGLAGGGAVAFLSLELDVEAPALWDPEHPRLHDLQLTLSGDGGGGGGGAQPAETVAMRIGFREVRIVDVNRVAINGRFIKARGTTRHEAHPLAGRSLWALEPAGKQWERDILLLRDANINYIRTSHYPPAAELMAAADELGMLIELEMPFCWASSNAGEAAFNYTVQAQREAMVANRNFASVIFWSLGNESPWNVNFNRSLGEYLREIDSTRPFMFDGGEEQPVPPLDILSVHYPSFDGPAQYANGSQPTLFGEYAHLNCYNRREIVTDPGVRDIWALGIEHMWELIWASPGVLGACYWAGIDE